MGENWKIAKLLICLQLSLLYGSLLNFYDNNLMLIASIDVTSYDKPTSTSSGNPTSISPTSSNPTAVPNGILL